MVAKILKDRHFVVGTPKNFKLLPGISFDCYFRALLIKSVLAIFNEMKQQLRQPILSTIVDPYTSNFQILQTFAKIFDSLKIQNVSIFYFEKRAAKKFFLSFLKWLFFLNGQSYLYKFWEVQRNFCGLSKKCSFVSFP